MDQRETSPAQWPAREHVLGGIRIGRLLPRRELRTIGPWCFLDHMGPTVLGPGDRFDVPPHPHIGLQTVTWLLSGGLLHRDSLGFEQVIEPGQLNLMTAGSGISHSEESLEDAPGEVHGVQFWVALPESAQSVQPDFEHHGALPVITENRIETTLIMGEMAGKASPATTYSPLVAVQIRSRRSGEVTLPLKHGFQYGLVLLEGEASLQGGSLEKGALCDLGSGREAITLVLAANSTLILIGGKPLEQNPLLWWNFVAWERETIEQARADWQAGHPRFGSVEGYAGAAMDAPELSGRLVGE